MEDSTKEQLWTLDSSKLWKLINLIVLYFMMLTCYQNLILIFINVNKIQRICHHWLINSTTSKFNIYNIFKIFIFVKISSLNEKFQKFETLSEFLQDSFSSGWVHKLMPKSRSLIGQKIRGVDTVGWGRYWVIIN